jgi:hypothetical protein
MESLAILIGIEIEHFLAEKHKVRGHDYLTWKVLDNLQRRWQNKVQHWHGAQKQYTITLDKGEAWALFYHFNNRIEEYHPVKTLLGQFHQSLS